MTKSFGEAVRERRLVAGLSQGELGKMCGLDSTAVNHYEAGRRSPGILTAARFARALNTTIDSLVKDMDLGLT